MDLSFDVIETYRIDKNMFVLNDVFVFAEKIIKLPKQR